MADVTKRVPTEEEIQALRELKYKTQLRAVHPGVVTAVSAYLQELLRVIGRGDLAEAWRNV